MRVARPSIYLAYLGGIKIFVMNMLLRLQEFLPTIVSILGVIGGVFGTVVTIRKANITLKKWRQKRTDRRAAIFRGNWDNMAQRILPPTHFLDLETSTYGKKVEGKFNVCRSDDENSWEMYTMLGSRQGRILRCKLYKNFGAGKILVAIGVLEKKDIGILWKLKEAFSNEFPVQAVLQRGFPKVF
jgi:hypothetical protein